MDDMFHVCRWCKHFKDGLCVRGIITPFAIGDRIADPDTFYCKHWE